jgi:hypothetical protein
MDPIRKIIGDQCQKIQDYAINHPYKTTLFSILALVFALGALGAGYGGVSLLHHQWAVFTTNGNVLLTTLAGSLDLIILGVIYYNFVAWLRSKNEQVITKANENDPVILNKNQAINEENVFTIAEYRCENDVLITLTDERVAIPTTSPQKFFSNNLEMKNLVLVRNPPYSILFKDSETNQYTFIYRDKTTGQRVEMGFSDTQQLVKLMNEQLVSIHDEILTDPAVIQRKWNEMKDKPRQRFVEVENEPGKKQILDIYANKLLSFTEYAMEEWKSIFVTPYAGEAGAPSRMNLAKAKLVFVGKIKDQDDYFMIYSQKNQDRLTLTYAPTTLDNSIYYTPEGYRITTDPEEFKAAAKRNEQTTSEKQPITASTISSKRKVEIDETQPTNTITYTPEVKNTDDAREKEEISEKVTDQTETEVEITEEIPEITLGKHDNIVSYGDDYITLKSGTKIVISRTTEEEMFGSDLAKQRLLSVNNDVWFLFQDANTNKYRLFYIDILTDEIKTESFANVLELVKFINNFKPTYLPNTFLTNPEIVQEKWEIMKDKPVKRFVALHNEKEDRHIKDLYTGTNFLFKEPIYNGNMPWDLSNFLSSYEKPEQLTNLAIYVTKDPKNNSVKERLIHSWVYHLDNGIRKIPEGYTITTDEDEFKAAANGQ